MPRPCQICTSAHLREVDRRLRANTPHTDVALWLASVDLPVHRSTVDRHAKHTALAPARPRGPRTVSEDFLEAVRDTAHDDLRMGELKPTLRDGITAQGLLDTRTARNTDRDLMYKIALALTGHVQQPAIAAPRDDWDDERDALEGEYRALLPSGDDERDAFAEIDAERLRAAQR